jgi:lipopolysaccharide export system protein LptA
VVVLALAAVPAAAQISRTCNPELLDTGERGAGRHIDLGGGRFHQYASGGVLIRCIGQSTTIRSDSLAWYSDLNRLDFVGSVRFRDSTTALDADQARYFPGDERLEASGNVHLEDQSAGSTLTGTNLTYYRAAPGLRDTSVLVATQRPRVEYRERTRPADPPYVIYGDRVRLRGRGQAWASGQVTVDRADFSASGDSADLDIDQEMGTIVGNAEASGRDSAAYAIRGRTVAFRMTDGELRWVQAQDSAEAESAEWHAVGDTIEFSIARNRLQSGIVWGRERRPEAVSATQSIVADSLAIDAPDQVLTEIRGYGAARATTWQDSAQGDPDWLAGETLVARFDSTEAGKRILRSLVAEGGARALYHVLAEADLAVPPSLNYARGRRITVWFREAVLERVDIVEQADGLYLEPIVRRPP